MDNIQEELIKWLEHTIEWYKLQAKVWVDTVTGKDYLTCISTTEYILKNIKNYPDLTYHGTLDKSIIGDKTG